MYEYETVQTPYSKKLKVYIQGTLDDKVPKTTFLTVHDVGANERTFVDFVDSPFMSEVKKKSLWLHVVLPGQDDGDALLPSNCVFPSMDDVAKDLSAVLDAFKVSGTIVGFGEGAGANILLRFGLIYPNRCLGLILIDCTSSAAGFDEQLVCKMYNLKENGAKMWHKLVTTVAGEKMDSKPLTSGKINSANVGRYLDAYLKRNDVSPAVARELSVDLALISGSGSPYVPDAYYLNRLNCSKSTVLILDDKSDVIIEAPKNLARALILFCKGIGVLISVPLLGLEKEFKRIKEKRPPTEDELQLARTIRMYEEWVDFAP